MALGQRDTVGVNQYLIDWSRRSPQQPVGIVFMDFVTVKRAQRTLAQSNVDEEEEELDLIRVFIEKQIPR